MPTSLDPATPGLRDELLAFQAHYAKLIADDRLEEWPLLFVEQCLYRITTHDNETEGLPAGLVWADSQAMLHDRVSALRHANIYERQRYRHLNGLPMLLGPGERGLQVETPFLVARIMHDGFTDLFATGVYRDQFVRTPEGLRLASRVVVCDSSRIDTLLAIPL